MSGRPSADTWREIGWNGLSFHIPASWQPTAIYPAYLFFELEGKPALEVKWQPIRGRFSAAKIRDQLQESLPTGTRLEPRTISPDIEKHSGAYTVSGFRVLHRNGGNNGLVLFCPECNRVTLLQWYVDADAESSLLARLLASFQDHGRGSEQVWSLYDIRAVLPREATLTSHEFVAGRYTLGFDCGRTAITLYRFKPASVLLQNKRIAEFGRDLFDGPATEEGEGWASWSSNARGLNLLLAKARRRPVWRWMRLRHDAEHNGILGVKAEGKKAADTEMLERISRNYCFV